MFQIPYTFHLGGPKNPPQEALPGTRDIFAFPGVRAYLEAEEEIFPWVPAIYSFFLGKHFLQVSSTLFSLLPTQSLGNLEWRLSPLWENIILLK